MVSDPNPQHRVAIMRREMLEVLDLLRAYERSAPNTVMTDTDVRVVHAREKLEALQAALFLPVKEVKDEIPG